METCNSPLDNAIDTVQSCKVSAKSGRNANTGLKLLDSGEEYYEIFCLFVCF